MVQRKRLFVILLMVLAALILLAETVPARLLSEPSIRIPMDWEYDYEIMEVLTEITVMPDSTAFLEAITDGKVELYDIVDTQIKQMLFSPMIQDSIAAEVLIKQSFNLVRSRALDDSTPEFRVNKDYIKEWIKREFVAHDTFAPILSFNESSNHLPSIAIYRQGYHYSGLYNPHYKLSNSGFSQAASPFGNALYLGYYHSFGYPISSLDEMQFSNRIYNEPVPLADIQAGIGDYEFKYARGSLKKNHLFDIKDIYYGFDFLVQTGDWTEVFSDQTSTRHILRIPMGKTVVNLAYENYAQNIAMTQLVPVYWQPVNFTIDHVLKSYSAVIHSPFLSFAWRRSDEKAKSTRFDSDLKSEYNQFLIRKDIYFSNPDSTWSGEFDARYEKIIGERNYEPVLGGFEDRAHFGIKANYKASEFELKNDILDFERAAIAGDLGYRVKDYKLGMIYTLKTEEYDGFITTPSIYTAGDTLRAITISNPRHWGWYVSKTTDHDLSFKLVGGLKNVINNLPYQMDAGWINIKYDRSIAYASLLAQYSKTYGMYHLDVRQSLTWHQYDNDLRELPQYGYQTYLNLQRTLPHNNALFAGFGAYGHSSYLVQNLNNRIIDNSTVIDLWGGFKITNLFEIVVSFKNALDGTIYGVYPIPQSLHAGVRWFYLN